MFIPGTLCLRNQERSSEVRQAASPLSIFSLWPVFPGFLSSVLTASFWCFALHLNTQGLLLLLCPGVRRHRPLPITTDSSFIFCSPVLTSWTWPSKVSISSGLIQGIKSTGCPRNSQSWVVSVCSQRMSLTYFSLVAIPEFSSLKRESQFRLFHDILGRIVPSSQHSLSSTCSSCPVSVSLMTTNAFTWCFLLAFFVTEPSIPNPTLYLKLCASPVLGTEEMFWMSDASFS